MTMTITPDALIRQWFEQLWIRETRRQSMP